MNNLVYVPINQNYISELLTEGNSFKIVEGLPKGSKLVGVNYDTLTFRYLLVFEHNVFDEVKEGTLIPTKEISIQKL